MEPSGPTQPDKEARFPPTVSRDKWRSHILTKLSRGYVLIVGHEKRIANFFMRGKGYESCAYDVARQLVQSGLLVKAFDHYLGGAYTLAEPLPEALRTLAPARPAPDDDDDSGEMDELLDELAENAEEEEEEDYDEDDGDGDRDEGIDVDEVEDIDEDEDDLF